MVFITARVHPGETPASFVCQGENKQIDRLCCQCVRPSVDSGQCHKSLCFILTIVFFLCAGLIEFLVGSSREAKVLRDHIVFKIGTLV